MRSVYNKLKTWTEGGGVYVVAVLFFAYGFIHGAIARLAGPTLALDDVKLNILTQSWQGGYLPSNPPLFEWVLGSVQWFVGPTLLSFSLTKYLFLSLVGVFVYLSSYELFKDRRWATLAAVSLVGFYQIGWNFHQAFTHSTALLAAISLFWWTFLRLRQQRPTDYLFFGVALGVGVLSKYSFVPAAAIAIGAGMRDASFRTALISPKILISAIASTVLILPHAAWLFSENANVISNTSGRLSADAGSYIQSILAGIPSAIWAIFSYFLPFAIIAFVVFPTQLIRMNLLAAPTSKIARDAVVFGAIGMLGAVLVIGMDRMQERYAIPFLFPAVFWWIDAMRASAGISTGKAVAKYLRYSAGLAGVVIFMRIAFATNPGQTVLQCLPAMDPL